MKLMEWKQSAIKWDQYKAFHMLAGRHWGSEPVVQFDTGEVVIRSIHLRPHQRGHFDDMNIVLFSPRDNGLLEIRDKLRDPDDNKVCIAQLIRGHAPLLLWDRDTNRIVRCGWLTKNEAVPSRMRSFNAYFPGEGRAPIGGDIEITTPRKLTPEEKEHTETLIAACKAWYELSEEGKQIYNDYRTPPFTIPLDTAMTMTFATAPLQRRAQIAVHGIDKGYTTRCVPYLQVVTDVTNSN